MKRLLILRHAKAEKPQLGQADFDRPLTQRGRVDATRLGAMLTAIDHLPQAILASPAKRTRQTAELVAQASGVADEHIHWQPEFYHADLQTILDAVQTLPDTVDVALVVGHNPTMEEFVAALADWRETAEPTFAVQIPPGGLTCFDVRPEQWAAVRLGTGTLRWFLTPKLLRLLLASEKEGR